MAASSPNPEKPRRTLPGQAVRRLLSLGRAERRTASAKPDKEALAHAETLWHAAGADRTDAGETLGFIDDGNARATDSLPVRTLSRPDEIVDPPADYELVRLLGAGGMGEVWQARQPALNRAVAVKLARGSGAANPEARARFAAEAVVAGELRHPDVVVVHELAATPDGRLFYAMQENAGALWSRARRELPLDRNLDILARVAEAVGYAHSRGILHRDVKPANVLLGEHGEVVLSDWGVAVSAAGTGVVPALSPRTAFGGTPCYMAPEQAMGDWRRVGFATDVYLLGACLYEILTGRPPHPGGNSFTSLTLAARNELTVPKRPTPLMDVALKAMATRPEERYATVLAFLDALREARLPGKRSWGVRALVKATWTAALTAMFALAVVMALTLALIFLAGDPRPLWRVQRYFEEIWADWQAKTPPPRAPRKTAEAFEEELKDRFCMQVTASAEYGDEHTFTRWPQVAWSDLKQFRNETPEQRRIRLATLRPNTPQNLVRAYVYAQPWRKRKQYVVDPERVGPLMEERYATSPPPETLEMVVLSVKPVLDSPDAWTVAAILQVVDQGREREMRTVFHVVRDEGRLLIDWESME